MRAMAALIVLILLPLSSAFDLSPSDPDSGDKITLTGSATPGEQLSFRSSFSLNLPVTGGQYQYETSLQIPQKPNSFLVSARNVQDLNAGVKMGIWLTKRFQAKEGTASLSQDDVPPGRYDIKMFGESMPGAATVSVDVVAETATRADSLGKYNLVIDTTGIPNTEYRIAGAGDVKTIRLGGSSQSTSRDEEEPARVYAQPKIRSVEMTREVIAWYADQIGLDPQNGTQFGEAKGALEKRLKGGYWKIIARGEPLTEEAGNCKQKYCLVRGADACTVCRDKDMLLRGNESAEDNLTDLTEENAPAIQEEISPSQKHPGEERGFSSRIIDWILRMLHIDTGGGDVPTEA